MWFFVSALLIIGCLLLVLRLLKAPYALNHLGINSRLVLVEQLRQPPYMLASKIVQKVDKEEVRKLVLNCLAADNATPFLCQLFVNDLSLATKATLLRENSEFSKTFSEFASTVGRNYLIDIVAPHVQSIITSSEEQGAMEVFPEKLNSNDDGTRSYNQRRLRAAATAVLKDIMGSGHVFPKILKRVLAFIRQHCKSAFSEELIEGFIGSFLFLRFLCPPFVMPRKFDLVSGEPNPNAKRSLVLVARILQQVANQLPFQTKQAPMIPFNDVILQFKQDFHKFFECITVSSANTNSHEQYHPEEESTEKCIQQLELVLSKVKTLD